MFQKETQRAIRRPVIALLICAALAGCDGDVVVVSEASGGDTPAQISALAPAAATPAPSATGTGSASLSWAPPVQNTDGSQLNNLAGYRIYHGTDTVALDQVVDVPNSSVTSYSVAGLSSGVHYFAMSAYTAGGAESDRTPVGSKTIP